MRKSIDWLELLLLAMAAVIIFKVILYSQPAQSPEVKVKQETTTNELLPVPQNTPEFQFGDPKTKTKTK